MLLVDVSLYNISKSLFSRWHLAIAITSIYINLAGRDDSLTRRPLCMWVELVVGSRSCSEGFSPGSPVFLPRQNPRFLNSNSAWNAAPGALWCLFTSLHLRENRQRSADIAKQERHFTAKLKPLISFFFNCYSIGILMPRYFKQHPTQRGRRLRYEFCFKKFCKFFTLDVEVFETNCASFETGSVSRILVFILLK